MSACWLGILVLSLFWLRALHILLPPSGGLGWLIAGALLLITGCMRSRAVGAWTGSGQGILLLFASILGIAWLPYPYDAGFLFLGAAALFALLGAKRGLLGSLCAALRPVGAILVFQAAAVAFLYIFSAHYHDTARIPILSDLVPGRPHVPWLALLLYLPIKLLQPGASLQGSAIYLVSEIDTLGLTPTWEKAALVPLFLFATGGAVLLSIKESTRRSIPRLLALVAVYGYARLLALFLLVNQFRSDQAFWATEYLFLSLLPLALLAATLLPQDRKAKAEAEEPQTGNAAPAHNRFLSGGRGFVLATGLLAGGLTGFFGFHDPGSKKGGRVLIDEGHSDWEWTTRPFDTTWFGGKSGYNYYCLADYWNHYYHVESRTDSLTPDLLSQWDVLVIKTPTQAFSREEIDAIEDFVREGGGLYLIGDHTNVFGTSTYLNPIAERFGMRFNYDATYNLPNLTLSLYRPPRRFAHPVVKNIGQYLFATSCSLDSPPLGDNVILGYGLRAMYLDYSEVSYFPIKEGKMDYDFGIIVQAAGVHYGKGRVLGYTDSTCFSNFFMFIPGKPQLALSSIDWLNRENRLHWLRKLFLVLAAGGFVLLLILSRAVETARWYEGFVAVSTITLVLLGFTLQRGSSSWYKPPLPKRTPTYASFDQSHGCYNLAVTGLPASDWRNFQTFYVWTQRLGIVPRNEDSIVEALADSRAVVEVMPCRDFTIAEIDSIQKFVWDGGALIVLDSPANAASTAERLLGSFMVSFSGVVNDSVPLLDSSSGDTLAIVDEAFLLEGVDPVFSLPSGEAVMGSKRYGEGKVIAFGAAYLFSDLFMGSTATVPDQRQRRIYRAEFDIFSKLAGIEVEGRYAMEKSSR